MADLRGADLTATDLRGDLAEAAAAGVIVLHCSKGFGYVGRDLGDDIDNPSTYGPAALYEPADAQPGGSPDGLLLLPIDHRTVASEAGPEVYSHFAYGGGSWGVPWLAGVIALALQCEPALDEATVFAALRSTAWRSGTGWLVHPQAFIAHIRAHVGEFG